jgi:hypothetical protein
MFVACGDARESSNPRCTALCDPDGAAYEDQCSESSVGGCIAACEARLESARTLCGECLLEGADFGEDGPIAVMCSTDTCDFRGCTYPRGDGAAERACHESEAREVDCDADFRPITDCATVCE